MTKPRRIAATSWCVALGLTSVAACAGTGSGSSPDGGLDEGQATCACSTGEPLKVQPYEGEPCCGTESCGREGQGCIPIFVCKDGVLVIAGYSGHDTCGPVDAGAVVYDCLGKPKMQCPPGVVCTVAYGSAACATVDAGDDASTDAAVE